MITIEGFVFGVITFVAGYSLGMWKASIWRKLFYRADQRFREALVLTQRAQDGWKFANARANKALGIDTRDDDDLNLN